LDARIKPKIRNVVCTASLAQSVNVAKLAELPCGIYDEATYGGRCGYVKTPEMKGRVTVFPSGKMISVGGRSVEKAVEQLNHAKLLLVRERLVSDTRLSPIVRNIVATSDAGYTIPIDTISSKIPGAVYDPESFPALIMKGLGSCSFLVFASGKIVISGAKSVKEANMSSFELMQRIDGMMTKHGVS